MDGVHDLGGMQGFGPVEVEPDEPAFHREWEGRTFAVAGGALGTGRFNSPMFRHAIERMEPGHYLTSSYYEHWVTAVATLLVEEEVISRDELDARAAGFPLSRPAEVSADDVDATPARETPRFCGGRRGPSARPPLRRPHPLPPLRARSPRRDRAGRAHGSDP